MNSHERVMTALDFGIPDRVPRFDGFWPEWEQAWRHERPELADVSAEDHFGVDISIAVGDETLCPSRAEVISETESGLIRRDGWGRVIRTVPGGFFYEQLESALKSRADLDALPIDPPDLESRYAGLDARMPDLKQRYCVFAKVGGPFIRSGFVRGDVDYLVDMAEDPDFAAEFTMRIADHLIAIGLEELRRWELYSSGVWIYDDMASNSGPMFSPRTAERVLVPAWAKMVRAFKDAGARKVILHSDGNIGPLLDTFVDIGFNGINPVEPKAGLNALELRRKYGKKLALLGGVCNAFVLPRGCPEELRAHVLEVLSAGVEGGLVIGTHSIGPDISVETYEQYARLLDEFATYPMHLGNR